MNINLLLLLLLLFLRFLYSPVRTFASLMDFSQSSPIDLTVPRPHLRFPNCWLFLGWGRQPRAQPPPWRTRSPYLYHLETTFYDMHGLQCAYSFPRSPHGEDITNTFANYKWHFLLKNVNMSIPNMFEVMLTKKYKVIFQSPLTPRNVKMW
jgi:hypothetical protein